MRICLLFLFIINIAMGQEVLPPSHYKVREAEKVLNTIASALQRSEVPKLVMYRGKRGVLIQTTNKHSIWMDEEVYDITRRMGPDSNNALSYIFGHELHHYYADDFFCYNLSSVSFIEEQLPDLWKFLKKQDVRKNVTERKLAEIRADKTGSLWAYQAGFSAHRVAADVLKTVYATYDISESDTLSYPSMEERIKLVEQTRRELSELLPLYEAVTHWILLGRYAAAIEACDRLIHEFPSREIYYTRGVIYMYSALRDMPERSGFVYPLEIDFETHLQQTKTMGGGLGYESWEDFLEYARKDFETAKNKDETYMPARIGLACVSVLLGKTISAQAYATEEILQKSAVDSRYKAQAEVILGILAAETGDKSAARKHFSRTLEYDPGYEVALINRRLLDRARAAREESPKRVKTGIWSESICGISRKRANRVSTKPISKDDVRVSGNENRWGFMDSMECLYVRLFEDGNEETSFCMARKRYTGESDKGIRIGSTEHEVRDAYGEPLRILNTRQGKYLMYSRIGFLVRHEEVIEWMIWW